MPLTQSTAHVVLPQINFWYALITVDIKDPTILADPVDQPSRFGPCQIHLPSYACFFSVSNTECSLSAEYFSPTDRRHCNRIINVICFTLQPLCFGSLAKSQYLYTLVNSAGNTIKRINCIILKMHSKSHQCLNSSTLKYWPYCCASCHNCGQYKKIN